jgi:ABC-type nitrate/sulfonate/bicarbonate transport system substrate-binding protein
VESKQERGLPMSGKKHRGFDAAVIQSGARASRRSVLAGLGATLLAPTVRAQTALRDLTIPLSSYSFATISTRAAEALGCFARHGLNVKFIVMDSGSNITTALVSGSAQVILGGPGELVAAQARGQKVVLLTNVYWGMSASLILAKDVAERSGVSASAPDGLLIASPSATSSYTAAFKGAAEAAGGKMRLTYMSQPAMVAALEAGAIQGYIAGAPIWGASLARGKGVLWVSGPKGELPYDNTPSSVTGFNAMRSFAEANPDVMRQLLDGYRDFSDLLEKDPAQVRAAVGKLYPDVDAATMDVLFAAESPAWKMRQVTEADMKHEVDFMRISGLPLPGMDAIDPKSMLYIPPK